MADAFSARFLFSESKLSRFLKTEAELAPRRVLAMSAVAGLSNALILALINAAAEHAEESQSRPIFAVAFAIAMVLYAFAQRWVLIQVAQEIEKIIHKVRMRIIRRIRECELLDIEQLGRTVISSGLARHTQTLSQSASTVTIAVQMAILIVFTTLYIAYLSLTSFAVLIVFMAIALSIYFRKSFSVRSNLQTSLEMDNGVYAAVDDLLSGFKEAKLSRRRTQSILNRAEAISSEASTVRGDTQTLLAKNFIFSQSSFYLLLGTMVFIVPLISSGYSDEVQKSTTAVLFIIGPISGLIGSIPIFENASAAAGAIADLEKRLTELSEKDAPDSNNYDLTPSASPSLDDAEPAFETIELRDAVFQFPSKDGESDEVFKIGPINLTMKRGETTFITGGNGSGKSTLLRLLTGLYPLDKGRILLDGKPLQRSGESEQNFRELFSSVFGDFHLSRHLDGVPLENIKEADYWMERLEIQDKVKIEGNAFSTTDLSSGQRKRLALVAAILDRKPVLVLDEWAADQDPLFRRTFYKELLPLLKERGHTIIAITHDSRFFDAAEQQFHMEDGKMSDFDPAIFHD